MKFSWIVYQLEWSYFQFSSLMPLLASSGKGFQTLVKNDHSPHGNAVFYAPEKRMNDHELGKPMVFYTRRDPNGYHYNFAQQFLDFGK